MISENLSNCSTFEIHIPFAYDGMIYINEVFKEDILRDFTVDDNIKIYSKKEDYFEASLILNSSYKDGSEFSNQANVTYLRNAKAVGGKPEQIESLYLKSSRRKDTKLSANEHDKERYKRNRSNELLSLKRKLN